MSLGELTLGALALAIVLSCTSRLNVGLLAIVLAWVIGVYFGHLPLREVMAGFPVDLFLTLAGVTLLFSQARVNGTLDIVAHNAVRGCRGASGWCRSCSSASARRSPQLEPGNIATAGLWPRWPWPPRCAGHPAFLMAIMVGNGCNSGSLSPIAPTGIIADGRHDRIGLGGHEISTRGCSTARARARRFRRRICSSAAPSCSACGAASRPGRPSRCEPLTVTLTRITLGHDRPADPRRDLRRLQHRHGRVRRGRAAGRSCARPMTARRSRRCPGARS